MRQCFNNCCENGKEVEYADDDTRVVTDEDCHVCGGTGEVEECCYCHAYEPRECCCGWDSWYASINDDYNDYLDEVEHREWSESMSEAWEQ